MHVQADSFGIVVRLYDVLRDNPAELSLGRDSGSRVWVTVVDRDSGSVELTLTLSREELVAGLALVDVPWLSVDSPDGGVAAIAEAERAEASELGAPAAAIVARLERADAAGEPAEFRDGLAVAADVAADAGADDGLTPMVGTRVVSRFVEEIRVLRARVAELEAGAS